MTLRIGIDLVACIPGRTGGVESYAVELARALTATSNGEARIIAFAQPALARRLERDGVETVAAPAASSAEAAFWSAQMWLPPIARRLELDVIHHTKNYVSARCAVLRVVTLHDLFPAYFLRREPWRQLWTRGSQLLAMLASAWRCGSRDDAKSGDARRTSSVSAVSVTCAQSRWQPAGWTATAMQSCSVTRSATETISSQSPKRQRTRTCRDSSRRTTAPNQGGAW